MAGRFSQSEITVSAAERAKYLNITTDLLQMKRVSYLAVIFSNSDEKSVIETRCHRCQCDSIFSIIFFSIFSSLFLPR